jgi:hypothetical protein
MNNAFANKLIKDELKDTLFFATGEYPITSKAEKAVYTMKTNQFTVVIKGYKNILVNEEKCKSPREAKWEISNAV